MSTNLNQYTKVLGEYNTTLKEYREALQRGDSYTKNQKYHDLVEISGKLKAEFAKIEPNIQTMKAQYHKLKDAEDNAYNNWEILNKQYTQTKSKSDYQKMTKALEIVNKAHTEFSSFEKESKFHEFIVEIINEMNKLQTEQKEIRIHYNETRSEGDLISKEQRQQDTEVDNEIRAVDDQFYSLSEITSLQNVKQETKAVENYTGHLSESELETTVLDPHTFYRTICDKVTSQQYTSEQFNKIYKEVSENLAKKPITVAEIIKFCTDNGIPHFSDDEFRSLIKNENKAYENTNQSVRDIADYHYIAKNSEMTASHQTPDSDPRGNVNTATIVDADSFYKFIDTKMLRKGYTNEQYNKLYVDISEVLVHSPLTKGEINQIYYKHNITPPTEREWSRLIERQESRRETDYISKNSDDLKFQGNVDIDVKDQNFKLKVDLYYRDKFDSKIKASQDEGKSNSKFSGEPERDPIQSNNEFQPDINNIQSILLETTKVFNESFGIRKSGDTANFRVFIFDDAENYLKYSKEARGHANTSDNGNTANVYLFFGDNNYNDDNDLLRHEFAHALTFHATSKLGLSRTFMEGIAEYVVGRMHGKSNADFTQLIPARNFDKSIEEIMKYTEHEDDHYHTGAAIVAYLEENHPNFLDNLLYAANDAIKNDRHTDVMEMMNKFFQEQGSRPISEIEWFKSNFNYGANDAHTGHPDHHSSGGYSGPPAQAKILNEEVVKQPETQKPITLDFKIERGEPINEHYFSARIKLTEDSRDKLHDVLGDKVQFNNLGGYFDLDFKNFRIVYNKGGHRDELYIKDDNGHPIVNDGGGWPLNYYYTFSVKMSSDGTSIIDYSSYGHPRIHDNGNLLETTINNALGGLLKNEDNLAVQDIYAQASYEIARDEQIERDVIEEKQQVEEKQFNEKNAELKEAINKGDIILFEVVKGKSIDSENSAAVLQLTEKSREALGINDDKYDGVELDLSRFHIKEIKHGNITVPRFYDNANGGTALPTDRALFVLDKSNSNLSGFYSCLDKGDLTELPARWVSIKNKFNLDSEMHDILYSHLNQQSRPDVDKQAVAGELVYNVQQDYIQKHDYSNNKQFSNKGAELKKAIKEGDVIVYRMKENSNSDGEHSSTTFKMIKKSKEVEANNEYQKSIKLNSKDFDIKKVMHQEGIEEGDQLFYVLYKNDPSESGFYNLGKEKVGFNTLVKSLEDPKYKCSYYDNIDDKFSISDQDNHNQQHKAYNGQMQSDQPQAEKISHDKHHIKHEDLILKDTILSVGKGEEVTLPNGQKIHKVEIKIECSDINSLYKSSSSKEEQEYVKDFYHNKLSPYYRHDSDSFKIGDLPQKQYYFEGNKFIIKNKNGIELSRNEGKISLQLMHLKDHQGKDHLELVVLNKANGKVIGNIHEIDNLSYGLLKSDSDIFSHLEIQGHDITIHSNDYDTYLTHGLDNHVLGNHHGGDHALI